MREYLMRLLCALLNRHAEPPVELFNGWRYCGYCPRCHRLLEREHGAQPWREATLTAARRVFHAL